jgi:hypothetical protein
MSADVTGVNQIKADEISSVEDFVVVEPASSF